MNPFAAAAAFFAAMALSGQGTPSKYAAGQVWEYHARPQDAGSLVRVQRVERMAGKNVYHVSIVGVRFVKPGTPGDLPHLPVSDETLDASVTKLSTAKQAFPTTTEVEEGVDEWRKARGGVFTIPLSQIVDIIDDMTAKGQVQTIEEPTGS